MFIQTTAQQLHTAVYNHTACLPQASFFGQHLGGIRQRKTQHWLCQRCAVLEVKKTLKLYKNGQKVLCN
jgi:hypothetical protein